MALERMALPLTRNPRADLPLMFEDSPLSILLCPEDFGTAVANQCFAEAHYSQIIRDCAAGPLLEVVFLPVWFVLVVGEGLLLDPDGFA